LSNGKSRAGRVSGGRRWNEWEVTLAVEGEKEAVELDQFELDPGDWRVEALFSHGVDSRDVGGLSLDVARRIGA
jgi:hypothetical protein